MSKTEQSRMQIATRVTRRTLIGNILLSAFQLFAGVVAGSAAMISDAFHSISDMLGEIVVLVSVRMSSPEPDKDHPYGHERIECVAGILVSVILFVIGGIIGWNGLQTILAGNYEHLEAPGVLALWAAVIGIGVKECMYWYTRNTAKKIDSVALMASAWHSRSDAISSIGSFAGIFGARMGFPILDSVASVIICLFILRVAFSIYQNATKRMTDKACDDETIEEMRALALAQEAVLGVDLIKTRIFGDRIYVDMEISSDGNATLFKAHQAAEDVHDAIEARFPKVKHCMIHVNPHVE
ncbi:MAG: cation diffusion facilitator family transporter [Oscillospiraceae bacterium]|nr:cation diffusion facilitator family transporter [Oscillospiraceae bacterium]